MKRKRSATTGRFIKTLRRNPTDQVAEARQLLRVALQQRINALNSAIAHWNPGLLGAMATLRKYKSDLRTAKIKLSRLS
jgi:hypothetical protein